MIGYEKYTDQEGWFRKQYQIRAFKEGEELDRLSILCPSNYFTEIENVGSKGIKGVQDVIRMYVPCEGGCGCTTGYSYVFWDGKQLVHAGDFLGTADADYSEDVSLIFPSEMQGHWLYLIKYTDSVDWEKAENLPNEWNGSIPRIVKKEYFQFEDGALKPAPKETEVMYFGAEAYED